jgi:hypothetical protein
MASSGKRKTTMAKLTRESRLRERRLDKQARKEARKRASALDPDQPGDLDPDQPGDPTTDESVGTDAVPPAPDTVVQAPADA